MKTHDDFLKFNNVDLVFTEKDGETYVALKPILDALKLPANSVLKRTRRDRFLGGYTSIVSLQVDENGGNQRRPMTCLPEKYIYGWIGTLNGTSDELAAYKETCYELLYNHFKGKIGSLKKVLVEKQSVERRLKDLKNALKKEDPIQQEIAALEAQRKRLSAAVNKANLNLIAENELFPAN